MRSESEMLDLIVGTAMDDDRIRAVVLGGSRADPRSRPDPFRDFDIVYVVTSVGPYRDDRSWIDRFGELMILQMPDLMDDPPPCPEDRFTYLMQFADGNRIDLTLIPVHRLPVYRFESLSVVLLDRDGAVAPLPPPDGSDFLPSPPSEKEFHDCCNEFWWVCPYAAKGLWRRELPYARHMLDVVIRGELMRMLEWYSWIRADFTDGTGKCGKHLRRHMEPGLWSIYLETFSDGDYGNTWDAMFSMCELFRSTATAVAAQFGFDYPHGDDHRVSAHLKHVRALPPDSRTIY